MTSGEGTTSPATASGVGGALIKAGLADSREGYPHDAKQARHPDKRCTSTSSGAEASDTYTRCRAYSPDGTSSDDQGRRYTRSTAPPSSPAERWPRARPGQGAPRVLFADPGSAGRRGVGLLVVGRAGWGRLCEAAPMRDRRAPQ